MSVRYFSLLGIAVVCAAVASVAIGQADKWYPSRWGANDQRGAANRITPAKVLEAKNLITKGAVYQPGRTYESGMPMFGTRHYSLRILQPFEQLAFGSVRSTDPSHLLGHQRLSDIAVHARQLRREAV